MSKSRKAPNIRLFIDQPLSLGQVLMIDGSQGHYLSHVMRLGEGDGFKLFNGQDGEWEARITKAKRGRVSVLLIQQTRQQPEQDGADLWYLFTPLKKARLDYMIQKATELGVRRIMPVITDHTHMERMKEDRIKLNAIEAAEQCERLTVPACEEIQDFDDVLSNWPDDRYLIFCDEAGYGDGVTRTMAEAIEHGFTHIRAEHNTALERQKAAILIGPEGGFSEREREMIRAHPLSIPVTLGALILRADTAAVVSIALWQSAIG